ncbi:unnamed protein product [Danaus chrysippus]|uniref:(African queen) hypothetical protein n=1 Tax=Danaus chrysippus TaxID=151541 RepID=A0A8J2W361_9NEOP|nr:unnamed protein product [Danaus chrysippus]
MVDCVNVLVSQDDDEDNNEFNYGNYTNYNYQTTTEPVADIQWPQNVSETTDDIDKFSIKSEINSCDNITPISLNNDNTSKVEEAIVEDLNLIIDKDIDSTDLEPCSKQESNKDDSSVSSDNDSRIKDNINSDVETEDLAPTIDSNESTSGSPYFNEEICDKETQKIEVCNVDIHDTTLVNEINGEPTIEKDNLASINSSSENVIESENVPDVNKTAASDDDFGDFEDFQFTSTQSEQVLPISSENPWDDTCESSDFVEFKANFDNNEVSKDSNNVSPEVEEPKIDDDDDDFGDFNDFKSSEPVKETMEDVNDHMPVFDVSLPDNELQICESISGLLTPIFAEEILEPDDEIVGKLESFLSETWGHLIDIDVRQPYMVNWNNSLGQKTLLKALCIDSRNILFGPKWHYNMPKYAANLSAAPLQPQKQVQTSNSVNTDSNEKTNKEPNTWVDPFTQDGQEYTYAEALLLDLEHLMATLDQMAHKHSTLKISELLSHACNTDNESTIEPAKRPTDLDVFGDTPTPMNKIYSSTIKVQPVRHINLPDTHIFTPTDSETPRSKTIHYDTESNPVPIPIIESSKNEEKLPSDNTEIDNEYWEFQDFKAQNEVASIEIVTQPTELKTEPQPPVNTAPNPGVTYQTQILQPIKMEPVMPTLNWPDPGEVKETFDDFSDFISNSAWNTDKGNNSSVLDKKVDEDTKETKEVNPIRLDSIDDDFNTFQTAPASTVTNDFLDTFTSPQIVSQNFMPKITPDKNKTILSESKDKIVDHSSMKTETKSPSLKANATDSMFKQIPNNNPIKHLSSDILQPTNASTSGFNRNQQNSVQILQPLSLEGYSQINWPNPGIDLQDLSRFNPVDSVHTIKNDGSVSGNSKGSSPAHNVSVVHKEIPEDDIWGDFVSSVPKPQTAAAKTIPTFLDDDEWTDFVSSPSVKPINGLSTISLNVHTNLNMHKSNTNKLARTNQMQLDIPQLNYITPKSNNRGIYTEKHFQNL